MSEKIEDMEQNQDHENPEKNNEVPAQSALNDLFSNRDNASNRKAEKEVSENKVDGSKQEKKQEPEEGEKENEGSEKPKLKLVKKKEDLKDDDEESELDKIKNKLEKTEKSLSDTKQWGRSNSTKLGLALKKIKELSEELGVSEDESNEWIEKLRSNPAEEESAQGEEQNPLTKIINIANQKMDDLKEFYGEEDGFQKKLKSFNKLVQYSTEEEFEELMDELMELENNPIKLAKRMYAIGSDYYETFYKEIDESGGFRKYHEKMQKEIQSYKKKIDKLEKKMSQYEDYDKPTFKGISELNDATGPQKTENGSVLQKAMSERDRVVRR